jgi:hypothetical protein
MNPWDEAHTDIERLCDLYGRDAVRAFLRFLASRDVADSPTRQRGYRDPLPTNGTRTRTDCQRGEGNTYG